MPSIIMRTVTVCVLAAATLLSGCSTDDGRDMSPPDANQLESVAPATTLNEPGSFDSVPSVAEDSFVVTGPWTTDDQIDQRYTCDGRNISPPLSWSGAPEGTAAFAIVLSDLDAPAFSHWTIVNIESNQTSLTEGQIPSLAVVANNENGAASYLGPCPPKGSEHSYHITVYALGEILEAQMGDPAPAMRAAVETSALSRATTTFTYQR